MSKPRGKRDVGERVEFGRHLNILEGELFLRYISEETGANGRYEVTIGVGVSVVDNTKDLLGANQDGRKEVISRSKYADISGTLSTVDESIDFSLVSASETSEDSGLGFDYIVFGKRGSLLTEKVKSASHSFDTGKIVSPPEQGILPIYSRDK